MESGLHLGLKMEHYGFGMQVVLLLLGLRKSTQILFFQSFFHPRVSELHLRGGMAQCKYGIPTSQK
jgi:hypothetical protein